MDKKSELYDIKPLWRTVRIDGQNLRVEYDYRAYAMIEEATSKSVYELKDDFLSGKFSLTNQLLVLYFGLLKHQSEFSLSVLRDYPNIGHLLSECLKPMLEAFFTPLLPPAVTLD